MTSRVMRIDHPIKVAGTPTLGHFLCLISLYLQNYAVVGIYKINFDCSENNLH